MPFGAWRFKSSHPHQDRPDGRSFSFQLTRNLRSRLWFRQIPFRESRTASGSGRPADGRSVPITSVRPTTSLRFQAPSVGRSLLLAARGTGTRRSVLPGRARCRWSPVFEPRAVASVPRTVDRFRSLLCAQRRVCGFRHRPQAARYSSRFCKCDRPATREVAVFCNEPMNGSVRRNSNGY